MFLLRLMYLSLKKPKDEKKNNDITRSLTKNFEEKEKSINFEMKSY